MTGPRRERRHRFPTEERLRTDREFREVVRKGERVSTAHYTIYRDALGGIGGKVGVSAGKRAGGSVVRNRMKRLLREFYRLNKGEFPPGTRTAIVVRKAPEAAALSGVCDELLPALRKRWGACKGTDPWDQGSS
ncbi:MAG: ribonuclease P protein component [Thermodesulfobacteriota bacterium]